MRLAPAAPGALWREACAGGAMVEDEFIPAGLDIAVCTYALSHNPDYFPDPFKFDPERFVKKSEDGFPWTVKSGNGKLSPLSPSTCSPSASPLPTPPTPLTPFSESLSAFAPFAIGPRSCLAKPLAYLELSLAVARILFLMDFEAVDNTGGGRPGLGRGREREEEFQIIDMFSSNKQGPNLRFKTRPCRTGEESVSSARIKLIRQASDGFH